MSINTDIAAAIDLLAFTNSRVQVMIFTCKWRGDREYRISHQITVGDGGTELKLESDDILECAKRLRAMWKLREGIAEPHLVQPLLTAPPVDVAQEAEFVDVTPALGDDLPF